MKTSKIHIGSLIQQKVNQSSLTVAEFARRINRTRQNVYDIFKRSSIDTALLKQIQDVLHYDFFKHFNGNDT
jgi:plasmid maintenance system antidote protein VapI